MANAGIDQNGRRALIGVSNSDGVTIVPIKANPTTHGIKVMNGSTGSNNGNNSGSAMLDENSTPVMLALSSAGDGTFVEVYADPSTGAILVNSN